MTRAELVQKLTNEVELFKGHTDGIWFETGHDGYMTAEFANVGQATMFAQSVIWNNQLIARVTGGDWDDSTEPAQVTISRK